MTTEHLRFAPEILRRLGEELVPHPDLGVIELVRNAYDADAPSCHIRMDHVDRPGGTVTVADDGDGMTVEDLRTGWLLLGRSRKTDQAISRKKRRRVGEKGLGRLAALRLGRQVQLCTRPRSTPGVEHVLLIDWAKFDRVDAVEDVELTIQTRETSGPHGTDIEISDLRTGFSKEDVARLARALLLLTGPFPALAEYAFDARLDAPEFAQLEKVVHTTYFDEHEYLLTATLDDEGQAAAQLVDWRDQVVATGDHHDIGTAGRSSKGKNVPLAYAGPSATFQLWTYNLSTKGFTVRRSERKVEEVRQWLRAVGGVHLYHRGLRVHPYGDDGHDWLDMNLRRARSPEGRPSTNTSVGRVVVNDDRNTLTAKTDRSGFVENAAFVELRMFCQDVLDWAAFERLRLRERRREETKRQTRQRVASAKAEVERRLGSLPPETREVVEEMTESLTSAYEEQVQTLEDEVQLYRTLGTVGTTTAVFAHESSRPLARIEQAAGVIDRWLRLAFEARYEKELERHVMAVMSSAASLRTFTDLPLGLVSRKKRRPALVDINAVTADLVKIFEPHLAAGEITVETELAESSPVVRTTVAAVEAILANLLANAAYAFTVPTSDPRESRIILIRTTASDQLVIVSVLDNGPGIDTDRIPLNDIWLPGQTTREGGTGLGLTIVRDVVNDLDGSVHAKAEGELGGAEFHIELPRVIAE